MTIYQPVGCEPDPNCCAFSCGPHLRWVSASCAGFHLGGKLLGRSFLHPSLAMIVAQHDGAVEQGEADPRSVGREQGQDRPQEHVLEQLVERAEQQGSQAAPVAQDGFRLAVEGPRRAYRHDPIASLEVFDASAIRLGTVTRQGNSRAVEEDHRGSHADAPRPRRWQRRRDDRRERGAQRASRDCEGNTMPEARPGATGSL